MRNSLDNELTCLRRHNQCVAEVGLGVRANFSPPALSSFFLVWKTEWTMAYKCLSFISSGLKKEAEVCPALASL